MNRSDEDGAKLVAGSPAWKDYELVADLKLIGEQGNVGVIVRVSDEEIGADSYNGYYVGLRSSDSAFVVGRADHGWLAGQPSMMLGGVQTGEWYRLRVIVVGCKLAAQATNIASGATSYLSFEESQCAQVGRIGLRSIGMGGAWKNVSVSHANQEGLNHLSARSRTTTRPIFPIREDEYNRMMESLARSSSIYTHHRQPYVASSKQTMTIASAKAIAAPSEELTLRGVVTLTSPVYIQDDSAGIEVRAPAAPDLNLGDEIQATGMMSVEGAASYLHASRTKVQAERTAVSPVAITSAQAADGSFDGRLVQLSGTLLHKSAIGNAITLQLDDAEESFLAIGRGVLNPEEIDGWDEGSRVRIRGVCATGPPQSSYKGAFTILLRSTNDVEVLRGPPWWAPRLIARYLLLLLVLSVLAIYFYVRTERQKLLAIVGERERLAHDMHDTLAQSFAGLGFHLQGLRKTVRNSNMPNGLIAEKLDQAYDMVARTHREASAEIAALHPAGKHASDPLSALEQAAHAMMADNRNELEVLREGIPCRITLPVQDAIFQTGREAIANVLRHANATKVTLKLAYETRRILLEIRDNGCGFSLQEAGGFGIKGMQRRIERVGGSLEISSSAAGTIVLAAIPYKPLTRWANWFASSR